MAGLSGNLWPVHPHRLPDELLSFWILRTAHANRIKLQTFTNVTFGRDASPWARDIDRSAGPVFLATLAERTGSTLEELKGGMLSGYEGIVFEHHNAAGNTPWVLPLGIYHRTRRAYGMQFCPECLFWDEVPYFRRRWRLAFATICDRHGTLLHDRCPECHAPVIYFRNDLGHRSKGSLSGHTLCWQCQYDLRRAPTWGADWLDAETYVALRSLLTFIDDGLGVAGPHCFDYATLFLAVLHRVCEMLVSNGTRRRYDRLKEVVSRETELALPRGLGRAAFEGLTLVDRHRVVLCALWLLMQWPKRFVRVCGEAGLSRAFVLGDMVNAPYWFDRLLKCQLDRSTYIVSAEEAHHGAAYLAHSGTGISRKALQRVLGRRDNRATAGYASKKSPLWPATDQEFDQLLIALEKKIRTLPVDSMRHLITKRDHVIILTMKMTGWSARKVLGLTLSDVQPLLSSSDDLLAHALQEHLLSYLHLTRPALIRNRHSEVLFMGSGNAGMGIDNLAQKVRRLRRL